MGVSTDQRTQTHSIPQRCSRCHLWVRQVRRSGSLQRCSRPRRADAREPRAVGRLIRRLKRLQLKQLEAPQQTRQSQVSGTRARVRTAEGISRRGERHPASTGKERKCGWQGEGGVKKVMPRGQATILPESSQ
eukprot:354256-Chlamydomonas_euryale.AAC.8